MEVEDIASLPLLIAEPAKGEEALPGTSRLHAEEIASWPTLLAEAAPAPGEGSATFTTLEIPSVPVPVAESKELPAEELPTLYPTGGLLNPSPEAEGPTVEAPPDVPPLSDPAEADRLGDITGVDAEEFAAPAIPAPEPANGAESDGL